MSRQQIPEKYWKRTKVMILKNTRNRCDRHEFDDKGQTRRMPLLDHLIPHPSTFPSKQGWFAQDIVNMIQLIPLFGPTHDIFLPSTFLNYFRLPSIYTSLYIDIHIEYTYINYVTSCAPSRRTTYILFAPLLPLPLLFPFLLPLPRSFTLTHSRCTHCVYHQACPIWAPELKRKASTMHINAKKFNVGETSRTVKYWYASEWRLSTFYNS